MSAPEQLDPVAAYGAAWLATDDRERQALLEQAWAPDGVYCDPLALVTGRSELAAHIAGTQASLAGGRVEVTSEAVRHHDSALFHWRITDAAGATVLTGLDVVQFDDAGRIRRLTGFFDDAPSGA